MITKEVAEKLEIGDELFSSLEIDSSGEPKKIKVAGPCRVFDESPDDFFLPTSFISKTSTYHSYLTNDVYCTHWHTTKEAALQAYPSGKLISYRELDPDLGFVNKQSID